MFTRGSLVKVHGSRTGMHARFLALNQAGMPDSCRPGELATHSICRRCGSQLLIFIGGEF